MSCMTSCRYFKLADSSIMDGREICQEMFGFKPSVNQYIMYCIHIIELEPSTLAATLRNKLKILGIECRTVNLNSKSKEKLVNMYAKKKIAATLSHFLTAIIIAVTISLRKKWNLTSKLKSRHRSSHSPLKTKMDLLSSLKIQ